MTPHFRNHSYRKSDILRFTHFAVTYNFYGISLLVRQSVSYVSVISTGKVSVVCQFNVVGR